MIRHARAGDVEAFEALVKRHERRVLKVAYQMVGNLDDAQDIAQDVFIRLWKYMSKMRDEAKFTTWLYRLVVNASYDHLNRYKLSRGQVSLDDPNSGPDELADEGAIAIDRDAAGRQLRDKVVAALDRLTPAERTVFVLRDLEDLDVAEIAAIQGISKITVRRHLSTGRHKMRAVLTELYPGFAKQQAELDQPAGAIGDVTDVDDGA